MPFAFAFAVCINVRIFQNALLKKMNCLVPCSCSFHLRRWMCILPPSQVQLSTSQRPLPPATSNMTQTEFLDAVASTKEHIQAGDVFQLVLSQRFERRTFADPFEVYRSLRVVNPSPYMAYLQARGAILVASSPEILCRVGEDGKVTNRPLAGTRRRGATSEDDVALEEDLLADEKERAEHVMLVDLGRNDVGRVAQSGSVVVEKLMEIERYSHVMHISSTVTGKLLPGLNCWDALRAALPAGTVSGAPKVRAMQIIDELEAAKRGPYGGGIGHVSFTGARCWFLFHLLKGVYAFVTPCSNKKTQQKWCGACLCTLPCWRRGIPAIPKIECLQSGRCVPFLSCFLQIHQIPIYASKTQHAPLFPLFDNIPGGMDMALALRTMVVPTAPGDSLYSYGTSGSDEGAVAPRREWTVHIQAGAGVVADSVPEAEYEETVNKAAALGRAIDLAEQAFVEGR
jgi:anthranilate/para-aminobenzoate synthase component I